MPIWFIIIEIISAFMIIISFGTIIQHSIEADLYDFAVKMFWFVFIFNLGLWLGKILL
jgi:hypothetical protein